MTNKLYSALVAVAGGAALVAAPASQADVADGLSLSGKFTQLFQVVDGDDFDQASHSFNFPEVALDINAQFTPWLSMYSEFTNETTDNQSFDVRNDLTLINVSLLKAAGSAAADSNSLTLQFGTPVGGLSNYFNGSDGALVQTNPLIGNAPARFIDAMTGAKLIGSHEIGGAVKSVSWNAGYYTSNFLPQRQDGRGESINLRGRVDFAGGFSTGAGFVDSEDNSAFYNGNRDTFNTNGNFDTNIGVGGSNAGLNLTDEAQGWSVQGQWKAPKGVMLEGSKILGQYYEAEGDGNNDGSELEAFKILGQAYVVPDTAYLAARYTEATNESDGVGSDDTLDRFQIGGGVWLAEKTLLKAEYFEQGEEANATSAGGGGSDFDGFGLELSSTF
jgi:hypothetical protein